MWLNIFKYGKNSFKDGFVDIKLFYLEDKIAHTKFKPMKVKQIKLFFILLLPSSVARGPTFQTRHRF